MSRAFVRPFPIVVLATSLAIVAAQSASAAKARSYPIPIADGFTLAASYYPASQPGPGVLLLHQCNGDRSMWDGLAQKLSENGVHVMTLDYRGYGESTGPKLKAFEELDRSAQGKIHTTDISVALGRLRTIDGVDGSRLATGGASCGGPRSIALASEAAGVRAMVFLSSYLGKPALERFDAKLSGIPILAITAEDDGQTTDSLHKAFEHSTHPESRLLLYKGDAHGQPLFSQDPDLQRVISRWLTRMLRQ